MAMDAKMLRSNPYETPSTDPDPRTNMAYDAMRSIVFSWEKFRLLYNAILLPAGLVVLFFAVKAGMFIPLIVVGTIGTAIAANICFCAGPLAEFYFCALFRRETTPSLRKLLFAGGLLISVGGFAMVAFLFLAASAWQE
jgi:hypothetical protein